MIPAVFCFSIVVKHAKRFIVCSKLKKTFICDRKRHEFRPEFMKTRNPVWTMEKKVNISDTHQTEVICMLGRLSPLSG